MKSNVGGIDRLLRIVVGIALLAMFFVAEGTLKYVGLIGIVPLLTGLFRFCPLYSIVGLNTCPASGRGA
ncbi:MAG: DUF2892 domain-containing protein [Betaproteobacteria bacterium]|nr:DUF2892 domain-containing protein [Betaproteobacteria bacterium]MBL8532495.1 DUF2892 domain-containing protein [Betaproteobacteria bacterium]